MTEKLAHYKNYWSNRIL